jgi:Protein of unknown function (DUF3995)
MAAVSVLLAITLGSLAALHVYWALGGQFGKGVVIPERAGALLFKPSPAATLLVAAALVAAATCALAQGGAVTAPGTGSQAGCCVLAALFAARAVGEGRYVGFLKRVRNTAFARSDSWLYSPLCVLLATGFLALALPR